MQRDTSPTRPRRLLVTATATLALLLVPCASASALTAQTIVFTSSAPTSAQAGGSYTVSASSSSDLPVNLIAEGACSFYGRQSNTVETLGAEIRNDLIAEPHRSPAVAYFDAVGPCTIT